MAAMRRGPWLSTGVRSMTVAARPAASFSADPWIRTRHAGVISIVRATPTAYRSNTRGTAATAAEPRTQEEKSLARRGQPRTRARRTGPHDRGHGRRRDDVNSVLARAV